MLMSKLSNTISHENYSYLPAYLFLFIWGFLFILITALAKPDSSGRERAAAELPAAAGQGAWALQNTDLDKEAKREDLPLHHKEVMRKKQSLPQVRPTSP